MSTQRLEGKRVEERVGEEREREGEREKERTHAGEEEREREHTHAGESERALWLLLLYVFLHLGLPYANWA